MKAILLNEGSNPRQHGVIAYPFEMPSGAGACGDMIQLFLCHDNSESNLPRVKKTLLYLLCVLILWFSSPAASAQPSGKLQIIASNPPLTLLAQELLGDIAEVQNLLPPGQNPHHVNLRMSDRQRLASADWVFWVGPELEPWLAKLISKTPHQTAFSTEETMAQHHHEHHDHHSSDIHQWLDITSTLAAAEKLSAALAAEFPAYRPQIEQGITQFRHRLEFSERALSVLFLTREASAWATSHDAYGPLVTHFHLVQPLILSNHPETPPGLKKRLSIRQSLPSGACLITEPEFINSWPAEVAQEASLNLVILDLLATQASYVSFNEWLLKLGQALSRCTGTQQNAG